MGRAIPSTLDEAFQIFLSSIEPTETQSTFIAEKHKAIRQLISESGIFKVQNSLLYGSYERSSQIRPLPNEWTLDVDILVILDDSEKDKYLNTGVFDSGNHMLMNDLRRAIGDVQGLVIERDDPSIAIKWKAQKVKVEVTPALVRNDGGFFIPKKTLFLEDWLITDPFSDADALSKANQKTNGQFKPLVKALKCWNRHHGKILPSFAIETAAFYSSTQTKFRGYEVELRWFFLQLLAYNRKTLPSPSGKNQDVTIDLGSHESLINKTVISIVKAYDLEKAGRHSEAIAEMHEIFGPPFSKN